MSLPQGIHERLHLLFGVLAWLVPRGSVGVDVVAGRFGLDVDDVVTLVELAACCGVPPYTPDALLEIYVDGARVEANVGALLSRPRRLTPAEGFALAASCRTLLSVQGADPDGALARALVTLESALGERAAGKVEVELDSPPFLGQVRDAMSSREIVDIEYYSASRDEVTQRGIEPFELFGVRGHWYLDAWCHRAGAVRHFRVDRIRALSTTGKPFSEILQIPADGDVPRAAHDFFREAPDVVLDIPAALRRSIEALPIRSITESGDSRLTVTMPAGGVPFLERLLLTLGPGARVVSPPEWVDVGRRAAEALLERYRD